MDKKELQSRTKQFGVDVIALIRNLPSDVAASHVGHQLAKSSIAVGANYRASCRAKSKADFVSKMGTVEEEADESLYWLEVLVDSHIVARKTVDSAIRNQSAIRNPQ